MLSILRPAIVAGTLCIGLCTSGSLLAQPGFSQDTSAQESSFSPEHGGMRRGPMSPDQELAHLTRALDLTSDQQTQIKPILQDRHDQLMQMHQDASISREDRMTKMKTLDDDSNSRLQAVLNDQQKTRYAKMIADRKERMSQMRGMHRNNDDAGQPQQ